ncbi:MAG: CPBP family intramembrane glutamic endopeptidase [Chitinophagales bacterium]
MVVPDKKRLLYISWLTLFGMSAMGILLIYFVQKQDVEIVLAGRKSYYTQVLSGLFFGSLASLLGVILIRGKHFKGVRSFLEDMIGDMNPSLTQIIVYAGCLSVGEEMLFRAGIQPIINIWPAAFLFVLLHGYINPANLNLTIYGFFLVLIGAGLGYLFRYLGLFSAITAHFVYDVTMFCVLKYAYQRRAVIR